MAAVEILIPISMFITVFGIVYLFISTRHRERLSLIEKGADASIFYSDKTRRNTRRLIILNLALTLIGIGLGITIAIFLYQATGLEEVYPASIFTMAGAGLLTSFLMSNKYKD
ncbi:MAG: hypothetical protein HKO93_04275 [Flavobacteriales bacterium]|nr:hypothetical protein [Flavobacteriales bacterium]